MGQNDQVRQGEASDVRTPDSQFERLLAEDISQEKRIFWSEVAVVAVMGFLLLVYLIV